MVSESRNPSKIPKDEPRVAGERGSARPLQGSQGKIEKRSRESGVEGSGPSTVKDVLQPRGGGKGKQEEK